MFHFDQQDLKQKKSITCSLILGLPILNINLILGDRIKPNFKSGNNFIKWKPIIF
jgi:hypothetical protein